MQQPMIHPMQVPVQTQQPEQMPPGGVIGVPVALSSNSAQHVQAEPKVGRVHVLQVESACDALYPWTKKLKM